MIPTICKLHCMLHWRPHCLTICSPVPNRLAGNKKFSKNFLARSFFCIFAYLFCYKILLFRYSSVSVLWLQHSSVMILHRKNSFNLGEETERRWKERHSFDKVLDLAAQLACRSCHADANWISHGPDEIRMSSAVYANRMPGSCSLEACSLDSCSPDFCSPYSSSPEAGSPRLGVQALAHQKLTKPLSTSEWRAYWIIWNFIEQFSCNNKLVSLPCPRHLQNDSYRQWLTTATNNGQEQYEQRWLTSKIVARSLFNRLCCSAFHPYVLSIGNDGRQSTRRELAKILLLDSHQLDTNAQRWKVNRSDKR